MNLFKLHFPFKPAGDQGQAIEKLVQGLGSPSTLLGVTGSGKTFTIANVIAQQDKPVIILSPNKTLAAQLYEEFSLFFPEKKENHKIFGFLSVGQLSLLIFKEKMAEPSDTDIKMQTECEENNCTTGVDLLVKLISKDGDIYQVPSSVAKLSKMVEETILCDDSDGDEEEGREVHLPNVRSACLAKVVQFCSHYVMVERMKPIETPLSSGTLEDIVTQPWYRNFVNVEQNVLFELVTAANYMDIKPLLDLTCLVVAIGFMGKSAEEIRTTLNIPKLSPDEEAIARVEHRWIFGD